MKKLVSRLVAVLAIATSGVALAADVVFPNADGTGDLMSEAAWRGPVPTADRVKLTTAGTYYATTNGFLNAIKFNQPAGSAVMIDLTTNTDPDPTLTIGSTLDFSYGNGLSQLIRTTTFKGGTYYFQGASPFNTAANERLYNHMILDGCVWTNLSGQVLLNNNGAGGCARMFLKNGSVVDIDGAAAAFCLEFWCTATTNNTLEITGGSKFRINKTASNGNIVFMMSRRESTNNYWSDARVRVSGVGSELYVKGATECNPTLGGHGRGDQLIVENGGRATFVGGSIGTLLCGCGNYSADDRVFVAGEGSVITSGPSYFAYAGLPDSCTNNFVCAMDGGQFLTTAVNIWGGSRNGFVVSNGIVRLSGLTYPKSEVNYGTNFIIRLQGDHPLFNVWHDGKSAFYVKRGLTFVFDLPSGGYQADSIPVQVPQYTDIGDDTAEIEFNGLAEYVQDMIENGVRTRTETLMYMPSRTGTSAPNLEVILARWQAKFAAEIAKIPENLEASLDWDGKYLKMTTKVKKGFLLIFR